MTATQLKEKDLRAALEFQGRVVGAHDLDSFRIAVVQGMQDLIPCDVSAYNEINPATGENLWLSDPAPDVVGADGEAFMRNADSHPVMQRHQDGDPTALMLSDFLTRRKLRDTGIYQEFFGPISVNTQLAAMAGGPAPIVVAVSLNDESRDFDERDRALLNLVRPFIGAAFAGVAARQREVPQPERLRSLGLTKREAEVLILIAAGRTNKQIAAEFTVSPLTVKRHAENIYAKLEVSGRAAAVAVAISASS